MGLQQGVLLGKLGVVVGHVGELLLDDEIVGGLKAWLGTTRRAVVAVDKDGARDLDDPRGKRLDLLARGVDRELAESVDRGLETRLAVMVGQDGGSCSSRRDLASGLVVEASEAAGAEASAISLASASLASPALASPAFPSTLASFSPSTRSTNSAWSNAGLQCSGSAWNAVRRNPPVSPVAM